MAIYRGTGGAGDSTNDATVTEVTQQAVIASNKASEAAASATQAANSSSSASSSATAAASSAASAASVVSGISADAAAAEAAKLAAQAAQAAAELAETGAETAETNAETANTNAASSANSASTSATNAANSASSAATSASNASTSASAASTSATDASTSASSAATSATSAATSAGTATTQANAAAASATSASNSATAAASSASAASTSATNAATSETNAATSAANASTSETNASASETAAAGSASSASTSASNAATSATSASNSASAASTSATNAAASETNAATSETNAAASASAASTSATNAAASESAAATSATNASTAQTAAEAAQAAAEAAEAGVAADAAAAATSESNAASSATAAASSASSASTSASNAATSESNAASSATAAAGSASAASASADAALAALDNFDDRYLGQKASAPTVDNDGDPLVTGALYFDTTDDAMKVWDGTQWLSAYASLSGALIATNNLSDLTNAATARTNLGLGTAATTDSTAYATAAQGALADAALPASSYTAADVLTKVKTVDGSGSGLDADLLDGQQGSYYAAASSLSNYLPKANNSNHQLQVWDNRSTNTSTDLGLQAATFEFKDNATDSLSDGGAYHGVMTFQPWSDSTGGSTYQLGFTVNNNLWLRSTAIGGTWPTTWSKVWTSTNDGSGSGLDADLLDGNHASAFATAAQGALADSALQSYTETDPTVPSHVKAITTTNITNWNAAYGWGDHASAGYLTGNQTITLTGDVSGSGTTSINVTVADNSHNHTSLGSVNFNNGNLTNVNNIVIGDPGPGEGIEWAGGNLWKIYESPDNLSTNGAGNLQFVQNGTRRMTINTAGNIDIASGNIAVDDAHGFVNSGSWTRNQTPYGYIDFGPANSGHAHIYTDRPNFYFNKQLLVLNNTVWNAGNDGSGSGLDADTVDGLQGSSFLRSNANDVATGEINLRSNLDMCSDSSTTSRYVHLPRGGGITFYGDDSTNHSITSRNSAGTVTDDLTISSYGAVYIKLDANNNNSSGADFVITSNNSTTQRLNFSGENYNLTVSGNVTAYSDLRLKENIEAIPDALSKVAKLRGVTFTRNDLDDKETRHSGVIAQEVEDVMPEVVSEDKDGIKNVAYGNMVGLLIEAIKELKSEVDDLKQQLEQN